jgi:hypothetical protein
LGWYFNVADIWGFFRITAETGLPIGDPWFEHQTGKNEELVFPVDFNTKFTAQQSFRMKVSSLSDQV